MTNATGVGLPNICVYPFFAATGVRTADPAACTDSQGAYTLNLAVAGSYSIVFYDPSGAFPTRWYNNAQYEGQATPVVVTDAAPTTGINAVLATVGTEITGTVTSAAGVGIPNICVYPFEATTTNRTADPAACTNAQGVYTLSLVAPGSYNIVFYDPSGAYVTQWYRGARYEGQAMPVAVSSGIPTAGINATLTA